jgi:transcriptional regulator with XRE-family HTH domain
MAGQPNASERYRVNTALASMGKQIRAFRRGAKMSQYQLAKKAHVSMNRLGEIQRGQGNASVVTLLLIGRALDTSVGRFFSPTMTPPTTT